MADAWITPNFLANAESPSLGPLVGLLAVLPTEARLLARVPSWSVHASAVRGGEPPAGSP